MRIEFTKMEGLGNDFIFIDDRSYQIQSQFGLPNLAQKLCDRKFGIGADGIILIQSSDHCDLKFEIFNSDGSEAQMCGNGMRCFARLAREKGLIQDDEFTVETLAGTIIPRLRRGEDGTIEAVTVDMGEPVLVPKAIPFTSEQRQAGPELIEVNGRSVTITPVSMGNPHAVLFVEDINRAAVTELGPLLENHSRFPEKTNVEFVEVRSSGELRMKVWERGAGVTLACGTGACAALVAAVLNRKCDREAAVHLDGGKLWIQWDPATNHVFKTGPATVVFAGSINIAPTGK